ncbi:uracil DNA glycosylase a isoform X2 [Tachysurus fulvidraco]|uniref:uracil DNA glycosylase a isoform X2 n=1 Tax=Tachysurus fulvidraco TaxID=1234273 RepID=UPI000F51091F|nr:uracil DNA glycosylase a isoform X2 [Tachysurus fulvidraco]
MSAPAMAVLFINTRLSFLYTPCTRVLSKRWLNSSKYTKISSQVKKLKAGSEGQLSPEQLERIARNKAAALERLSSGRGAAGVGESWRRALGPEFNKQYFTSLMNFVDNERKKSTVYPPPEQVFTWTHMCQIEDVKVVVLGQDPYHGPNQAHGLCFSVQRPVPPPPSLVNMYKELESDIEGFQHPGHGDLTGWAKQGVLLLNAVLTVRAHQANSHKDKGWETFTDAVVQWLSSNLEGLVFMLWGAYAQKKETTPRPADRSPVPTFCTPWLLWMQTFLKDQRASAEIREKAHRLESTVSL